MRKTKVYKKGDFISRFITEKFYLRGWHAVEEREFKSFNAGKGILLFILAPILILFGRTKYIEVTYEKNSRGNR